MSDSNDSPDSRSALYKIRLTSGRILGPIDFQRVKDLVVKNRITGEEDAKVYPTGDWFKINQIPELAELILAHLGHKLSEETQVELVKDGAGHRPVGDQQSTVILHPTLLPGTHSPEPTDKDKRHSREEVEEKTVIDSSEYDSGDYEPTDVGIYEPFDESDGHSSARRPLSEMNTVLFERSPSRPQAAFRKQAKSKRKLVLWLIIGALVAHELLTDSDTKPESISLQNIKPHMPYFSKSKPDPEKSKLAFDEGIKFYVQDNVDGYVKAAREFDLAATYDGSNLKALALLASSYLNLIDSSSQDEDYFTIINRLIELARSREVDLPEVVISDVEFFLTVNRTEAARSRIVEYTQTHDKFGVEMLYYLGAVYYSRGDRVAAARYIGQIPENKIFSPKILYLKGKIAHDLRSLDESRKAFQTALKYFPNHIKSRLALAELNSEAGELSSSLEDLRFVIDHTQYASPHDLAKAYFLQGRLDLVKNDRDHALSSFKRAVYLHPSQQEYVLEYYTLRGQLSDSQDIKNVARMFYALGEGERLLQKGKYQDALGEFIKARNANLNSPLPLEKMGDCFLQMNDLRNAKDSYQKSAEMQPKNTGIWSKYIHILIESYEWDETRTAMAKFRANPEAKSMIDKLAGDLYAKQGIHQQALAYYRKAMSRDTIDPEVYLAYARGLEATKNCKDAPFFYALSRRYDPKNVEATLGIARCIAVEESPNRAILMLEDELQKETANRTRILSEIADLNIQTGAWGRAKLMIEEAKRAGPEAALPYRLEAKLLLAQNEMTPKILKDAVTALEGYSARNPSDAEAYVKQFQLRMRTTEFDRAAVVLDDLYARYPKYPGLHYLRGNLLSKMGNRKESVAEYLVELKNHPNHVETMIAMGQEYLDQQNTTEALKSFNQAMQVAPKSAEPKHLAGYANYLLKNYQGAIALYRSALQFDDANPMIYKRLGLAYLALGDGAGASRAFQKYLQLAPDAPDREEIKGYL